VRNQKYYHRMALYGSAPSVTTVVKRVRSSVRLAPPTVLIPSLNIAIRLAAQDTLSASVHDADTLGPKHVSIKIKKHSP